MSAIPQQKIIAIVVVVVVVAAVVTYRYSFLQNASNNGQQATTSLSTQLNPACVSIDAQGIAYRFAENVSSNHELPYQIVSSNLVNSTSYTWQGIVNLSRIYDPGSGLPFQAGPPVGWDAFRKYTTFHLIASFALRIRSYNLPNRNSAATIVMWK
jgi:hypothetical protein